MIPPVKGALVHPTHSPEAWTLPVSDWPPSLTASQAPKAEPLGYPPADCRHTRDPSRTRKAARRAHLI